MSRMKRWFQRRQTGSAALVLYTFLALAMLGPMAPEALPHTGADDICNHVSGIIEAKNALAEGQFPIRVPPHQVDRGRFPLFQFYGNFPYTLGGALYRVTRFSPYTIWKCVVAGSMIVGGFFTYRSVRVLTRQALPGLAAGAVFLTAPYLLTDIHGRVAFPEIVSFGLLPAVFYFAWRAFVGRHWGAVLSSGVSWCLLALSHNITFLYGSAFIGLFFLSYLSWRRRLMARWSRVGAGYALGWLLALWYLVPQQMLLPHLGAGLFYPVQQQSWLTPLGVLLAPSVVLPVHLGSPYIALPEHFGLQVGWLILAAAGVALYCLWQPRTAATKGRPQMVRLLGAFGLALFLTWSPFDIWVWLPRVFGYVQFSYRLLMFVVLFGAVLAGYALVHVFQGRMRVGHLAALVLAAGWSASPYLSPHRADRTLSIDKEIASPDIGRGGACGCYQPGAACLLASTLLHPEMDWVDPRTGGMVDVTEFNFHGNFWGAFPASAAGSTLVLEGTVLPIAQVPLRLIVSSADGVLASPELPAGPFALTVTLPQAMGRDRICIQVHGDLRCEAVEPPARRPKQTPSYCLTRFAVAPVSTVPVAPKLVPASQTLPQMRFGHPTVLRLHVDEPSLVQLPVLYYPYLLQLQHNGVAVEPGHLGRWVALELPPGDHEISVRFAGVGWANKISFAAWVGVALGALWLAVRSRQRGGQDMPWHALAKKARMRFQSLTSAP